MSIPITKIINPEPGKTYMLNDGRVFVADEKDGYGNIPLVGLDMYVCFCPDCQIRYDLKDRIAKEILP